MSSAAGTSRRIRLWDLPVRLVHWSVVLLLPALWWTWKHDQIATHERLGAVLLGLILFRLLWGVVGSGSARFAGFVRGPRAVARYVTGLFGREGEAIVGHNPLGGWSVVALLALLLAETVLGLFTQDVDGIESGPLTQLVSYDTADAARHWHGLVFDGLLALVALHLAAILFYFAVKRDNLVGPMLSGYKSVQHDAAEPAPATWWRALACAVVAAGFAGWFARGCPL